MKKLILSFGEDILSRDQMKTVKGGDIAPTCTCTNNDKMEKCDDQIRCVYGNLHYSLNKNGCKCP